MLTSLTFVALANFVLTYIGPLEVAGMTLMQTLLSLVEAGLILQIMWYGVKTIVTGGREARLVEVILSTLRPSIVIGLCLAGTAYTDEIIAFFVSGLDGTSATGGTVSSLQADLINIFSSGAGAPATPFASIDSAFSAGINAFNALADWSAHELIPRLSASISFDLSFPFIHIHFGLDWNIQQAMQIMLIAGILVLLIVVMCVLAFADLVVNLIGLKILFGVGPIFICLYSFKQTERYFQSWIKAVLKWTFSGAFLVIVVNIMTQLLNRVAADVYAIAGSGSFSDILRECLAATAAVTATMILSAKIGTIAGDLLGSHALETISQKLSRVVGDTVKGAVKGLVTGGPTGALKGAAMAAAESGLGIRMGGAGPGAKFMGSMGK